MEEIDYRVRFRWFVGLNLDALAVHRNNLHVNEGVRLVGGALLLAGRHDRGNKEEGNRAPRG
jgi:hypothetical protein